MVTMNIVYQGELRCEAMHGPSDTRLFTDAPVDNHGRGESFSPTDLVATALGSCMLTIMGITADKRQMDIRGTTVRVEKTMVKDPMRRIGTLTVHFQVTGSVTEEDKAALEHAALTCPVHHSLHPDIAIELAWQWPN